MSQQRIWLVDVIVIAHHWQEAVLVSRQPSMQGADDSKNQGLERARPIERLLRFTSMRHVLLQLPCRCEFEGF